MNTRIKELLTNSEGRYLNDAEAASMTQYADTMLSHLASFDAVSRAEPAIIDAVVKAMRDALPVMAKDHGTIATDLVRRDQTLILRYAATSMLVNDENFIYDKLAVWLRTILMSLCKPSQVLLGIRALVDACRANLTPADADALVPYIQVVITEFESTQKGQPS